MKILFETSASEEQCISTPKRNITNVFNIPLIKSELQDNYGIEISASAKRMWNSDIWYIIISAPYIGKINNLLEPPKGTEVALFVDYSNNSAFAMPRGGADKQSMMLIASVANKHIIAPFQCDSSLRYTLHSKGGNSI